MPTPHARIAVISRSLAIRPIASSTPNRNDTGSA
jgi:hypothetical protein